MAKTRINQYVANKYTEDIVYRYTNDEVDRYRKTERGVLLIHKDRKGRITERLLKDHEFPLSEFDRMKAVSDEDYRERNTGDVREHRHSVSLTNLEETRICSSAQSAEDEYIADYEPDEEGTDFRTIENAKAIMDACLTETQKRRFILYHYHNKSCRDIALLEGVGFTSVWETIVASERKIKKLLEKFPI